MTNKLEWGPGGCRGASCPHCPLGGTIRAAVRRHLYLPEHVVVVVVVVYSASDATSILPPSEPTSFLPPLLCDFINVKHTPPSTSGPASQIFPDRIMYSLLSFHTDVRSD